MNRFTTGIEQRLFWDREFRCKSVERREREQMLEYLDNLVRKAREWALQNVRTK